MDKKRILIIDDEEDMVSLVEEILKDEYSVEKAYSPSQAIELLNKDSQFDLILLDIILPEKDGWELFRDFKNLLKEKDKEIPVVIFSILKEPQDMLKAIKEGAVAYIVKPFEPEGLKNRIKEIFEKL
ncbi:MAG: response regulator [candidate division WOR-3 bacterium]